MLRFLKVFLFFVGSVVLLACFSEGFAQNSLRVAPDRVTGPIADADVVTIEGNVHPMAQAETDRGEIERETPMLRMMLLLAPSARQQRDLDTLTEAQQIEGSANYHQWLSAAEYGQRFGVSDADIQTIAGWLKSHGFAVEPATAGRRALVFSGTAGQVTDTFHTEMHRYEVDGVSHIANAQDPQVPRALAGVVGGVVSLHDFRRNSSLRMKPLNGDPAPEAANSVHADHTQGTAHNLFPADFAAIYDLDPLYAAGTNGAGISIAVVGRSNIVPADVNAFRSYAGLTANPPVVLVDGANPGLVKGDQDEATLDVEWAGGVAPGASVKFVVAASTKTTDGVDLAAAYIVNHQVATVMTTSFGNCEANMGATELKFYNSLWQQAASEGISAFVSSGDSGAAGCNAGSASKATAAAVNGLCTSPYVTCVGGTELNEGTAAAKYWGANGTGGGSAQGYIPETVWNESGAVTGGTGLWASGGGASAVYTQPVWQAGISGARSNGMRAVPDVSLTAALHDGYLMEENGDWYLVSGTSASSPSFAGIMALLVQRQAGLAQGGVNATLYGLVGASKNPFHATPGGNNSVPGVAGHVASGSAYNLATGLGSVDANVLAEVWPVSTAHGKAGFTLNPSVSGLALSPGARTMLTVTVAGINGFAGKVTLTGAQPGGVSYAFSPAVVAAGGSSTLTISVAPGTATGTATLIVKGMTSGLAAAVTANVGVTVSPAATLKVALSLPGVSVMQGALSAPMLVNVTAAGAFNGSISLAASGLPAGVTAVWSASSFTATSGGSQNFTLWLRAAAGATVGTVNASQVKITATNPAATAQAGCGVTVTAAPGVTVALSTASISMKAAGTQTVTVTATPLGGVKAPSNLAGVSFAVAGLPTGVTAAWGTSSLMASGAVESVLTLTGGSNAGVTTGPVTISTGVTDAASKKNYAGSKAVMLYVSR